jgi:uncharacterized protein YbjT (DUF2867 family)
MILVTGATGTVGRQVVDQLIAAHVGRVVYVSATPAAEPPGGFWRAVEELIEASGLEWTFLRPTGFAKNTLIWADQIRASDIVRWPYPDAARSLIHERDIAAVAVQALLHDELVGAMPVISGPEAITQADQIAAIGTAIGRELRYEDMPRKKPWPSSRPCSGTRTSRAAHSTRGPAS